MQAFGAMASEHCFRICNFLAHKEMDSQLFKICLSMLIIIQNLEESLSWKLDSLFKIITHFQEMCSTVY